MKFALCFSYLLIVAGAFAQTSTEQDNTHEIIAVGGITPSYLPTEFRNYFKNGWNMGLGYGCSFPEGKLGTSTLYASAEFSRFAPDREKVRLMQSKNVYLLAADPTTSFSVMVNFRGTFTSLSNAVQPYFLVGVGFLHVEQGGFTLTNSMITGTSQNGFAWSAGAGINFPVTQTIAVFLQARSLLGVFESTRQYFPLNAGVSYKY
jgi:opacity protein-like surface antigen